MGQGVDVDALDLAEVVDVLEDRVELVHRVDAVGLAAGLAPARAPARRHPRVVGLGVHVDPDEFELPRHPPLPAPFPLAPEPPPHARAPTPPPPPATHPAA